jgi:hypothetical protein
MKAQNNLGGTLGSATWFQRGAAVLAAVLLATAGTSLVRLTLPAAQAPAAAPALYSPNAPISGTGSVYDGSAYMEYLEDLTAR